MSISKKMLQAAAGQAGGGALAIEDVFSTYLYTGNGTNKTTSLQTITNYIDLSGEGGLVWIKDRAIKDHFLFDTERGATKYIRSNTTDAESSPQENDLYAFNSDGFIVRGNNNTNALGANYASWTFRKAPRFFDVVTYTGDGVAGRTVSHNLGVAPGFIAVKATSVSGYNWFCFHRSVGADFRLALNLTDAAGAVNWWNNTEPTATEFTLGASSAGNESGTEYVAYLFAHDPLGESGDGSDGLIACGSYTGSTDNTDLKITLGWEPQFVIIKNTSQARSWGMLDAMRGMSHGSNAPLVNANSFGAEDSYASYNHFIKATADGFIVNSDRDWINNPSDNYIYIAIRRGPMRQPTSGTEVFDTDNAGDTAGNPAFTSGMDVVDFAIVKNRTAAGSGLSSARLVSGKSFLHIGTSAEIDNSSYSFDFNYGWYSGTDRGSNFTSWMWRRAPGFFDVVAYTGDGVAGRTVSHNLGVAPEMMWVKRREANSDWIVYHKGLSSANAGEKYIKLNSDGAVLDSIQAWNDTEPTATEFTLWSWSGTNPSSSAGMIAYLFATLPGVSKVGSYTGNGSSQTIDCGFTTGARFILIKRTDSTGDWYVWDTERGIVAANDPHLSLNTSAAEVTTDDSVDPDSSGFIVNQVVATNINVSSASYIFYAIA